MVKVNTSTKYLTIECTYSISPEDIEYLETFELISGDRLSVLKKFETSMIDDVRFDKKEQTVRIFAVMDRSKNFQNELSALIDARGTCETMHDHIEDIASGLRKLTEVLTIKK